MLTFDQLDVLPDSVVEIYERYQLSVIKKIAEKLAALNYAAAAWQVERLNQSAMLYDDILAKLAEVTGQSEKELQKIFEKAGVKTIAFEDSIYKQAGLNPMPFNQSPAMLDVLRVGLDKTKWTLRNIINTTAITGQNAFIDAADLAYMQVSTGVMSYTEAVRDAVKSIADDGVKTIQYAGRSDQLDVAVRRAVLTGVGNTAAELQLKRAAEMGQDLIQMSAHVGARPTHQVWQGRVFSISGMNDKYPPFVESTGYGTVTGYAGINCRHSAYPFFEGISENAYKQADLDSYASKTVTYNGKDIDYYEATQKQRYFERGIRKWKREAEALAASGQDNRFELSKVREWQGRMRDFTKQTGLYRQREREQI